MNSVTNMSHLSWRHLGPGVDGGKEIDNISLITHYLYCRKLHRLTADSLLAMFLRKLREGMDDR